ncbi:MAG TPA: hypothetical protein VFQ61_05345 [Polyangiaceae bacterium]|nr:hypothetical protein [Polyangiaceae bacterium]
MSTWRRRGAHWTKRSLGMALMFGLLNAPVARAEPDLPAEPAVDIGVVEECSRHHGAARLFLLREEWQRARDELQGCLPERCPVSLRSDCADWQAEFERALATLYVALPDEDGWRGATLSLDGVTQVLVGPPEPIRLTPGAHRLVFSRAGYLPDVHEIVLRKGEARQLNVRWTSNRVATSLDDARPIPATTYWFSVGALTAFASTAVLGGLALSSLSNARQTCAPTCNPERRRTIGNLAMAADTSAVIGVLLSAFAVASYLGRPPASGTPAASISGAGPRVIPDLKLSKDSVSLSLHREF